MIASDSSKGNLSFDSLKENFTQTVVIVSSQSLPGHLNCHPRVGNAVQAYSQLLKW